ncbi:MAG: hypothetical protein ABH830_03345 [Patescibacteria group bacterium]
MEEIGGIFLDPLTENYINNKEYGIFLLNLLPWSSLFVFHRIKFEEKLSNGIVLVGQQKDLEVFYKIISEHLINVNHRNGFWGSPILFEGKIFLPYNYQSELDIKAIVEILSIKFRDDLLHVCQLPLSQFSYLAIKYAGKVLQTFILTLTQRQKWVETISLEKLEKLGITIQ